MSYDNELLATLSSNRDADKLSVALFFSAALHAVLILGLVFYSQNNQSSGYLPAMDIILLQNSNQQQSDDYDFLAQQHHLGGGTLDELATPSTPFTANNLQSDGMAMEQKQNRAPASEQQTTLVISKIYAAHKITKPTEQSLEKTSQKKELSELDMEIARLSNKLDQAIEVNAKRPRRLQVSATTRASYVANYMLRWVEKVERIGNLNLPVNILQQNLEGKLILEVELNRDGKLYEVKVLRSSGNPVLDNAALHIVNLATPFEPFTAELRQHADHIEIVRTWEFSTKGLKTSFGR